MEQRQNPTKYLSLGCFNRTPQTGWLINSRKLFLTLLDARSLRSRRLQQFLVSGENPLLGSQMAVFSLCAHMVEGRREHFRGIFHKDTNLTHQGSTLRTNHLPKTLSPVLSHRPLGFQQKNLPRNIKIHSITQGVFTVPAKKMNCDFISIVISVLIIVVSKHHNCSFCSHLWFICQHDPISFLPCKYCQNFWPSDRFLFHPQYC